MHREGHVGIGFLLYAPIAYWFIDLGWLMAFAFGMIAMGVWSFLPDIDLALPIRHRGPTHSITFAVVAGLLTASVFAYLAFSSVFEFGGLVTAAFWQAVALAILLGFALGFLGVIGHILGDVLTPMGVQPWWPRSPRKYSLALVLAADKDANRHLSFAGAVALTVAIVLAEIR